MRIQYFLGILTLVFHLLNAKEDSKKMERLFDLMGGAVEEEGAIVMGGLTSMIFLSSILTFGSPGMTDPEGCEEACPR